METNPLEIQVFLDKEIGIIDQGEIKFLVNNRDHALSFYLSYL